MKLNFSYAGTEVEFKVVYAKRSSLKIEISPYGEVIVTAPKGADSEAIIDIVKKKAPWILKKLYFVKNSKLTHKYITGEKLMYLGKEVYLQVNEGKSEEVKLQGETLIVSVEIYKREKVMEMLKYWYKEKTAVKILELVNEYSKLFSEKPRNIKVKEQKRRWASCTYYNDLLFNWRCSMASEEAIAYIVVHELCHMVHKNHSKDFWTLVGKIMPSYKLQHEWLRENGAKVDLL